MVKWTEGTTMKVRIMITNTRTRDKLIIMQNEGSMNYSLGTQDLKAFILLDCMSTMTRALLEYIH